MPERVLCLTRVLERVLGSAASVAQCAAGAALAAPLVDSMLELRAQLAPSWDGLVHRRVRWRSPGRAGGDTPMKVATRERAGWQLIEAQHVHSGMEVTHWLARRTQPAVPGEAAVQRSRRVWASSGPAPSGSAVSGPAPMRALCPADGSATAVLTPELVAAWARASGDMNAIHLQPGRALEAGLGVGSQDVVAHGLLLVAVRAAMAARTEAADSAGFGATGSGGEAWMTAALAVPPQGTWVRLAGADGAELEGPGGTVVRWRRWGEEGL